MVPNLRDVLFYILEEDGNIRGKLEPEEKNFLVDRIEEEFESRLKSSQV